MFLIFGIKRLRRRLTTTFALCAQCGRPAAQVVVRVSTWFSLFFIPVIPLGNKYLSTCTLCGVSTKLDKAQAQQMVTSAQQVAAQPPATPGAQFEPLPPPPASSTPPVES
jgi:zinc ribbon protein